MENIKNLEKYKKNYDLNGTAYIDKNFTPFNDGQYQKISDYCNNVEREFVEVGDADEPNHVNVGRFMTDIKKPEVVDNLYSNKLIEILWSENTKSYIKSIVNTNDEIYLRRVQYNQISKDCFVGYHLDVDSNPDYLAACVLQLGKKFNGGLYRVYDKDNKSSFVDYKPDYGSLIISDCQYPHEVTKVTDGERGSLVFFVSKNSDLNKRNK